MFYSQTFCLILISLHQITSTSERSEVLAIQTRGTEVLPSKTAKKKVRAFLASLCTVHTQYIPSSIRPSRRPSRHSDACTGVMPRTLKPLEIPLAPLVVVARLSGCLSGCLPPLVQPRRRRWPIDRCSSELLILIHDSHYYSSAWCARRPLSGMTGSRCIPLLGIISVLLWLLVLFWYWS